MSIGGPSDRQHPPPPPTVESLSATLAAAGAYADVPTTEHLREQAACWPRASIARPRFSLARTIETVYYRAVLRRDLRVAAQRVDSQDSASGADEG